MIEDFKLASVTTIETYTRNGVNPRETSLDKIERLRFTGGKDLWKYIPSSIWDREESFNSYEELEEFIKNRPTKK